MIELRDCEQLRNAIECARREAEYLMVRSTGVPRQYHVTNRKNGCTYAVTFYVVGKHKRYGTCTCKAGQNNRACKHIAAAAALNMWLAKQGLLNVDAASAA